MVRVVGTDPGTSSLDLLLLEDGRGRTAPVRRRSRLEARDRRLRRSRAGRRSTSSPARRVTACPWSGALVHRGPSRPDVAGPARRARRAAGVVGFSVLGPCLARDRTCPSSSCPEAFTCRRSPPIARWTRSTWEPPTRSRSRHSPSGSMAGERRARSSRPSPWSRSARRSRRSWWCEHGRIVDAAAGTRGPIGLRSGGAWDGEVAYWRVPLSKQDLFRGGLDDLGPARPGRLPRVAHQASSPASRPSPRSRRIYLSGAGH